MPQAASRITEPLRTLATNDGARLFAVVIHLRVAPGDPPRAAASIAAATAALDAAFATLTPSADERLSHGGRGSPFLGARLTGANLIALDAALDATIEFQIRRERGTSIDVPGFDGKAFAARVIAEPLASKIAADPDASYDCIVVLDTAHAGGIAAARGAVLEELHEIAARAGSTIVPRVNERALHPYVFATLTGGEVRALVDLDRGKRPANVAIERVWDDSRIHALLTTSIATVKADAAHVAYAAAGAGIVWAVLDSGVDETHPHFASHENLTLDERQPLRHRDFVCDPATGCATDDTRATVDPFGHGTHVAGIIAGESAHPAIVRAMRNEAGADERTLERPPHIAGMAPKCTILSYRVLDDAGEGQVSSVIDAFEAIQELNGYGRRIRVAGVNLSFGYPFDAQWFGCGQSPLCVEVDRLVRSGVVVVAAAGNSGYGMAETLAGDWATTIGQTINDPGNADLAITVGATHRERPHQYGVSYFSSKGPTGDGRCKPDLVAPGERIVSCASAQSREPLTISRPDGTTETIGAADYAYREDSGTSMAAPHVSGLIAAFLSVRREYVGRPDVVKALFVDNAADLKRDRAFQGAGLVDIMRVIQAV